MWILTLVLKATVVCSRGSRVRLINGLARTTEIPTSPGRPCHSFHLLCAPPPEGRGTDPKSKAAERSGGSLIGKPSR